MGQSTGDDSDQLASLLAARLRRSQLMAVRRTILSPPDRRQSRECRRLATLTEQLSELTGPGLRVLGWGRGVGGRVRDPSDAYVVAQNLQAVLCAGVNVLAPRLRASVSKSLVNQLDVTLTHDITCQRCPVERKLISEFQNPSEPRQNRLQGPSSGPYYPPCPRLTTAHSAVTQTRSPYRPYRQTPRKHAIHDRRHRPHRRSISHVPPHDQLYMLQT